MEKERLSVKSEEGRSSSSSMLVEPSSSARTASARIPPRIKLTQDKCTVSRSFLRINPFRHHNQINSEVFKIYDQLLNNNNNNNIRPSRQSSKSRIKQLYIILAQTQHQSLHTGCHSHSTQMWKSRNLLVVPEPYQPKFTSTSSAAMGSSHRYRLLQLRRLHLIHMCQSLNMQAS